MHKKLETDLVSLAHSILQMKNKEDVFTLKEKAQEIYEKLSVLAHVEEYIKETPNAKETKEELISKVEKTFELKEETAIHQLGEDEEESQMDEMANDVADSIIESLENETEESFIEQPFDELEKLFGSDDNIKNDVKDVGDRKTSTLEEEDEEESQMDEMANDVADSIIESLENETAESFIEQPFDELEKLFGGYDDNVKNDVKDIGERKAPTLEEELKDTISVDIAAELFEKATPKSLNDKLQTNIQIGLNDRIVFVKNLFNGSQEDFNRVVSQLNTHKTEKEAKKFINKMVKPDYNWAEHEELEIRFMEIIERRFA